MKAILCSSLISLLIIACSNNKNLAQSNVMSSTDSLIQSINSSKSDAEPIDPKLKWLQQENDLVISFGSLNYAWARRGRFYVLALQNKEWKLYRYDTRLPSAGDDAMPVSAIEISTSDAETIKDLYANASLWSTDGDNGENFCSDKKDCNINDAETWTLSVATKKNIHTTTYYAPEFFEDCCPGNPYRKAFISVAKAIINSAPEAAGGVEK